MAADLASIHFRTKDAKKVIAVLGKHFDQRLEAKKSRSTVTNVMETLKQDLGQSSSEEVLAIQRAAIDKVMQDYKMDDYGLAVIVVWKHFVSLYWPGCIRADNLAERLHEFGAMCKTPVLGLAITGDKRLDVHAVKNPGKKRIEERKGVYQFGEEEHSPVNVKELCQMINAEFMQDQVEAVLSKEDLTGIAEGFSAELALPIYMDPYTCYNAGMPPQYNWEGVAVMYFGPNAAK